MARRFVRRWLPDPASLRTYRALRWMGPLLDRPWLWHINRSAIAKGLDLIDQLRIDGHTIDTLDIGGGFAIDYLEPAPAIDEFCRPIRAALARLPKGVRVISEPGRYICGPAGIALSTVMGRSMRGGRWWYYLDDGIYGTFSGQLYDKMRFPVEPVFGRDRPRHPCVLSGPTCDSLDVIAEDLPMPKFEIGELLIARQIGAYTASCATDFNFFPRPRVIAVNVKP